MSKPKTNPYKVGDRIYLEHGSRGTVTAIDGPNVYISLDDMPINWMFSFDRIAGRLAKRKKKCERCEGFDPLIAVYQINRGLQEAVNDLRDKLDRSIELGRNLANANSDLNAKLAKYENADKFWVGESCSYRIKSSFWEKNRAQIHPDWDEHWQVAVIDKKKAGEE